MSNPKKCTHKKVLVRNTIKEKPAKTLVINEYEESSSEESSQKSLQEQKTNVQASLRQTNKFESPVLNSALHIARKIKSVENVKPRKVKSISDLDNKRKLAVDDKVSRQVNFPYEQHLYKDLIPLCVKTQSQPATVTREPLPQKDKEPSLDEFFIPKKFPEYSYQVPLQTTTRNVNQQHDGLKLHRIMQTWT